LIGCRRVALDLGRQASRFHLGSRTEVKCLIQDRLSVVVVSGGNQLSMYGSDEYILTYNAELGPRWRTLERWLQVYYPFFHADRIKTPTLFLGGDKDFNVPVRGGEQMYAALRTLGVPTQLIVYPGQFHLLTRPSYIRDCVQRYLAWFDRNLAPAAP